MGFVIGLIVAVIMLLVALGVVVMIAAAALWLFAATLVTGLAAGLSFAIAMAVQASGEALGYPHSDVAGLVCGIAFFVSTMSYAARRFLPSNAGASDARGRLSKNATPSLAELEREDELTPEADQAVRDAWQTIENLVPQQRARLRVARRSCAQVLALGSANAFDPSLIEVSIMLKRNLPQLATTMEKSCAAASPPERKDLLRHLVDDVERLGERAARELIRHREALSDELMALRAHIAARTSE